MDLKSRQGIVRSNNRLAITLEVWTYLMQARPQESMGARGRGFRRTNVVLNDSYA